VLVLVLLNILPQYTTFLCSYSTIGGAVSTSAMMLLGDVAVAVDLRTGGSSARMYLVLISGSEVLPKVDPPTLSKSIQSLTSKERQVQLQFQQLHLSTNSLQPKWVVDRK
jgi:hypothetical protein